MADTSLMDKLVSLCKRRGFVFQSSEIYGGLGSVWDYGPLGVELKKNVKDRWWHAMVHARDDIEGLDAAMSVQRVPLYNVVQKLRRSFRAVRVQFDPIRERFG